MSLHAVLVWVLRSLGTVRQCEAVCLLVVQGLRLVVHVVTCSARVGASGTWHLCRAQRRVFAPTWLCMSLHAELGWVHRALGTCV